MKAITRVAIATAALVCALGTAGAAQADVTTDFYNWSLGGSFSTYGGGNQYHISQSSDGGVDYRWLDSTLTRTTIISGNTCADYYEYGRSTISPGDTSYHNLFTGLEGLCFVVRGRTPDGSTTPHDGRLRR